MDFSLWLLWLLAAVTALLAANAEATARIERILSDKGLRDGSKRRKRLSLGGVDVHTPLFVAVLIAALGKHQSIGAISLLVEDRVHHEVLLDLVYNEEGTTRYELAAGARDVCVEIDDGGSRVIRGSCPRD